MQEEGAQVNKAHKAKLVGNKAAAREGLRKRRAGLDTEPNRGSNPRAFQGPAAGGRKAQKLLRSAEKREAALHLPEVDKTLRGVVQEEPPLLVVVVGPPGAGKTTLIRSLVRFYAGRGLQQVRGPITVVAGRGRRLTFVECPNRLDAMCDLAKIADLVLLMVDGSYGFEMETFEFLTIAQVHGFPRMFGVVSHLDQLKTGKALKKRKKFLRHRFWHEVAAGAKLLCLAPMIRGMYRPSDVLNLHRLLISVEPKVQSWRNTHSCVLIDRFEDLTDPDQIARNPGGDRTIAFYGYTRGRPMREAQLVHLPGLGDFPIHHLSHQNDPCELETRKSGKSKAHRARHLSQKERKIHAPFCDVGGILYDNDAIYVHEDAERALIERGGEGLELLRELQRAEPMDARKTPLSVVRRPVVFRDEETMELAMGEVRLPSDPDDDDDEEDNSSEAGSLPDADRLRGRTHADSFSDPSQGVKGGEGSLDEYGQSDTPSEASAKEQEAVGGMEPRRFDDPDSVRILHPVYGWFDEASEASNRRLRELKDLFVTGNWKSGEADDDDDEDDEVNSKGYESEDSEFEAQMRGEKPLSKTKKIRFPDDSGEEGEEEEEEAQAPNNRGARKGSDALAGVKYSSKESFAWGAFSKDSDPTYGARAPGNKGKKGSKSGNNGEDDYDILADDGSHVEESGKGAGSGGDEALDALVVSFLNRESTTGGGPSKDSTTNGDDEGIQFYNEKDRQTRRNARATGEEDDESALVMRGAKLTPEQERLMQKKMEKKKVFDEEYDLTGGAVGSSSKKNMTFSYYHQLNRREEERKELISGTLKQFGDDLEKKIQLVGYFSGLYVRFVLENIPVEFVNLFDPCLPLLAGGLNPGEDEFRIVRAKLKRHRWYPKILKAQDPLLISMGWRRFQTQPIFASEDPNGRHRYLKYTPLHMHCEAAFYAPVVPPNTGFLAIPVRDQRTPNFRISCSGYTVGNDDTSEITKKLKLTGTPAKIEKTTVFIKGMFGSEMEATKFVGAKLKAVSGVRGIIKSAPKGKQGMVRATFEDKIFPSDIVFIRAWKRVEPPKYCSIQRNLVDPNWVGMRTMRELRWDYGVPLKTNKDSEYREIKRRHRVVEEGEDLNAQNVLLSRNMKMQLPYDMKEEFIPIKPTNELQERIRGATTVAPEPRELRRQALLDTFEDRADAMTKVKEMARKRARERAAKEAEKECEEYARGLKKAKKDTSRMREFRSQHKSRH
ncbi:unnamed protein product [Phytomonas sp. EM1]|nr:unnamed protein product [Phytomonas sp. EM1]|eukprot:CCW62306.1 unnamed protein product [Phytomonas sp. isolate EM1]